MHTPASRARAFEKRKTLRYIWFAENGPCSCGSWSDLQVHHVDPTTKVDHKVWSWSEEKRKSELEKCAVRCRPCHQKLHAEERWAGHGHIGTYKRGCRCEPCKAVKSIENSKRIR